MWAATQPLGLSYTSSGRLFIGRPTMAPIGRPPDPAVWSIGRSTRPASVAHSVQSWCWSTDSRRDLRRLEALSDGGLAQIARGRRDGAVQAPQVEAVPLPAEDSHDVLQVARALGDDLVDHEILGPADRHLNALHGDEPGSTYRVHLERQDSQHEVDGDPGRSPDRHNASALRERDGVVRPRTAARRRDPNERLHAD